MKYSPTIPLAMVLAAGIAGAAAGQTTVTPGAASTTAQPVAPDTQSQAAYGQPQPGAVQPRSGAMQPQAESGQAQPALGQAAPPSAPGRQGYNQPLSNPNMPMQPSAGQAKNISDQVRTAQEQLQAAGLYKGPADGLMDPDTRAAIANFQQQNGLRRTATLDRPTLDRLMASRTSGSGSGAAGAPATTPSGDLGMTAAPAGADGNTTGQATPR